MSTTDPDARVMKMGDGGFRPAVNVQFATTCNEQIIVGMDVIKTGSDMAQLAPMVAQVAFSVTHPSRPPGLPTAALRPAGRGQNRHHLRQDGKRRRSMASESSARREREPWLLAYSPDLALTARQAVSLYAPRMQIELSFRDLKSHRYGQAFEDSLTRRAARIEILLLLHALAAFAAWLTGLIAESEEEDLRLPPPSHAPQAVLDAANRLGSADSTMDCWTHFPLAGSATQNRANMWSIK